MILSSWKDVANYVGKTVQTVRLWHYYKHPLKLLRSSPSPKGRIQTTTNFVDAWLYLLSKKNTVYYKRAYQYKNKSE